MTSAYQPGLAGIRVLEIGSTVSGPAAGRILADFGAEVWKLEPPEGDHLRTWGARSPDGTSFWFKSHNRNKSFVTFDLHDAEDVAEVRALALRCDVLLENFRPGRLAEWGLGYEELKKLHPRLVYVSISGYGQDGPYAGRPGFGHIAESMSGMRYVTGFPDRPPVRVGLSIGDEVAAMHAVIGTLIALRARDRDGVGDHVDVSLMESLFSVSEALLPEYVHAGTVTERAGNRYLRAAPSATYETRDGKYLSIAGNAQPIFVRLCKAIGQPELATDPRFATNDARVTHVAALDDVLTAWAATMDLATASHVLAEAGVPAGPVYSIADIAADPHFQARGALGRIADGEGDGTGDGVPMLATPGISPRLARTPGRLERAARAVGVDQERITGKKAKPRSGKTAKKEPA
jgi:crotonobetainyl-CoA:carnitine CoA-transferase CaiB-like acyl-CoA transferase